MKHRFGPAWLAIRTLRVAFAVSVLIWATAARADENQGRLTRDATVGAAHDVHLKAGQVVQVLKQSGQTVVIMVPLPDGTSGTYQIDATAITVATTSAEAAPSQNSNTASTPAPVQAAPPPPTPVAAPAGPPGYPADFVGGPEFTTTTGKQAAGTASVVKIKTDDQAYIVSARHLLGPEGGFKKQTAAKDVPSFVQSIRIEDFSGGSQDYDVTGLLVPSKRVKPVGGGPVDDMAIFRLHDTGAQSQALPLAEKIPTVGSQLWVIARVSGGVPDGQVLQSGKVQSDHPWIEIQFDNDEIITAGASGAPVLNSSGEVVGVYSGHSNENGHVMGFIIPSALIIEVIKKADHSALEK
jgi:hypothetical protein